MSKTITVTRKNIHHIRIGELSKKDLELLTVYGELGAAGAATKLGVEVQYIYQRMHRLKKKLERWQNYINVINGMKTKYPRIRKSLTVIPQETWER